MNSSTWAWRSISGNRGNARGIYGAIAFANWNGVVLNVHVIISWELLGYIDHSDATKALQYGFLQAMKERYYSKRPEGPPFRSVHSKDHSGQIGVHNPHLTINPVELRNDVRSEVNNRPSK